MSECVCVAHFVVNKATSSVIAMRLLRAPSVPRATSIQRLCHCFSNGHSSERTVQRENVGQVRRFETVEYEIQSEIHANTKWHSLRMHNAHVLMKCSRDRAQVHAAMHLAEDEFISIEKFFVAASESRIPNSDHVPS